jgi:hypothetical protein
MSQIHWVRVLTLSVLLLSACGQTAAPVPTTAPAPAPTATTAPAPTATAAIPDATQIEERIKNAMSAAPDIIGKNATIVDYPADPAAALIELRKGTNRWTCFPDWPATPRNDPQCFDETWMEWFAAFSAGKEPKITTIGIGYMLQGGQDASATDPAATTPPPGQDWVNSPPHIMILVPEKIDVALYSTDHHSGGPYVMFAGTPYEHFMVPIERELVAQTTDKMVSAESAAPALIAKDATIVDYPANPADALIVIKNGTNGWTCFPDWPATPAHDPQCFDKPWMQWFEAFSAGKEPNLTNTGISYMLQGGQDASETDPAATTPPPGQDWVNSANHVMVVTPKKLDPARYGTGHHSGEPYIMFASTPYEHIMIPLR